MNERELLYCLLALTLERHLHASATDLIEKSEPDRDFMKQPLTGKEVEAQIPRVVDVLMRRVGLIKAELAKQPPAS